MTKKTCKLFLDNEPYQFEVEGTFFWGKNELLFEKEDNIVSKTNWKDKGYIIVNIFENQEFLKLKQSISRIITNAFRINQVEFAENDFKLEHYHKVVTSDELHNKIISLTRNLENSDFDFNIDKVAERIGSHLGYKLTSWVEELQKSHIQIRISRPNSMDINPPHKDGYLSYWRDIINVWIPIVGCDENSSLPIFEGSHLIPENEILRTESKGAKINGNTYYVPCILETKNGAIRMIRPNPKMGEAIIFTPFLIHGAAVNRNKDISRVSLELRFPRAKS